MRDWLSVSLRLRDDKVFHLIVTECTTYTELTIDAIKENTAVSSLNSGPLVRPHWRVLRVELDPGSVLTNKSCN